MEGQDSNRRGYDDPSYPNQQPSFNAPQNTGGNSFGELSRNRLSHQPPNPDATASRPEQSSSQQPFGYSYYQPPHSTAGTGTSIQNSYSNYPVGPSRQQQINQNYYAPPYSDAASSYQAAPLPLLANNSGFGHNQHLQRHVQPMHMSYDNSAALFGLDDALPDLQSHIQQPVLPLPFDPSRQPAAFVGPPVPPPNPPNPAAGIGGQPIVNLPPFESGLNRVYAALRPIATIITVHGDLNQARTELLQLSNEFLPSVEQMQLTVDVPVHEERGYQLWSDFNTAWLALFQAHYRRIYDLLQAGASLNDPQLMSQNAIYSAVTRISELAEEHVEDRELLDYGWGLWEASITEVADRCMELFGLAPEEGEQRGSARSLEHVRSWRYARQ